MAPYSLHCPRDDTALRLQAAAQSADARNDLTDAALGPVAR